MRLDIDDNSLHDMFQGKKDYIGRSWINGIQQKFLRFGLIFFLYIVAFFLIGLGIVQFSKKIGKKSYDYEKLYDDIKKLSISDSQYSLVAILNNFEGDSANIEEIGREIIMTGYWRVL